MTVEIPIEKWTGSVREVTLGATAEQGGTRTKTLTIGGETALPFLHHEGNTPHPPALGVEIVDRRPDDWSPILLEAWGDVVDDPAKWAKAADEAGADMIKLFPASFGGTGLVKAILAPLPQLEIVPVGGVNLDTAADFIRKGAAALGVGSSLVNQKLLNSGDLDGLTRRAAAFITEVQKGRTG